MSGQGSYTRASGETYVGQFKDNKVHGEGVYTWPSGEKYVGTWKKSKRHGTGTTSHPNGDTYSGNYKNHLKDGEGTYTYAKGNKFVGRWQKDEKVEGTFYFASGERYDGFIQDEVFNGPATFTWRDGRQFIGQFKDHAIVPGQGIEYLIDGTRVVFGQLTSRLESADGTVLRHAITSDELDALRTQSTVNKKLADERQARQAKRAEYEALQQQKARVQREAAKRRLIIRAQKLLIENKYLVGFADGIAGGMTKNAIAGFYRDSEIVQPSVTDYEKLIQDLEKNLYASDRNCQNDTTNKSKHSICFIIDTVIKG